MNGPQQFLHFVAKQSGSDRQLQDAVGVARIRLKDLDRGYLERWADELQVTELLQRVLTEAARADLP